MGARWTQRAAVFASALWLFASRTAGSVVTEPIVRLTLEGGYDSNVLYDGRGGASMERVSPDLGFLVKDHLWDLKLSYGGDFLMYQRFASQGAWNHRGLVDFQDQVDERLTLKAKANGSYAIDPIGLARLGIFRQTSDPVLILSGDARATWRATPLIDLSLLYGARDAQFHGGTGASVQSPGLEGVMRLTPRASLGAAYRFDVFQSATAPRLALAHELKAVYRWETSRASLIEIEAGPTLWDGQNGPSLLPEASATLLSQTRDRGVRINLRHGLSLGALPTPGVTDGLEGGGFARLGSSFRLRGTAGIWRGGAAPFGSNAVVGYAIDGEIAWLLTRQVALGLGASRFARLDDPSPALRRSIVGLRLSWELENR